MFSLLSLGADPEIVVGFVTSRAAFPNAARSAVVGYLRRSVLQLPNRVGIAARSGEIYHRI